MTRLLFLLSFRELIVLMGRALKVAGGLRACACTEELGVTWESVLDGIQPRPPTTSPAVAPERSTSCERSGEERKGIPHLTNHSQAERDGILELSGLAYQCLGVVGTMRSWYRRAPSG